MKYALLALLFLVLGYTLGLFISPTDAGLPSVEKTITDIKQEFTGEKEPEQIKDAVAIPDIVYPPGSYLTESDLLSIPGTIKPLGFRVGPPIESSAAGDLIDRLKDIIPTVKARYIGHNKQSVIILAGNYEDSDLANKDLRNLQPKIKERLEIVYLPACVVENKPDKEGYICSPPPPDADTSPQPG